MIIVLTHSQDVTADFMCTRLAREGLAYVRLDTDTLARTARVCFQEGGVTLEFGGRMLHPEQIQCVWLRRPQRVTVEADDEAEGAHASSEWGEALEGFLSQVPESRWINHPTSNAAASHKIEQLIRARRVGLSVPNTLVTQDTATALAFFAQHGGSVVVKPLSGGYLERPSAANDTQVYTSRVQAYHLEQAELLSRCPTLFQSEVDKISDVRVCAVDGRLSAVELVKPELGGRQLLDIRRDNMEGVAYRRLDVPKPVAEALLIMLRSYGLRFAAVDFALDTVGRWVFFEVNPGGQWAWLDLAGVSDVAGDLAWAMGK